MREIEGVEKRKSWYGIEESVRSGQVSVHVLLVPVVGSVNVNVRGTLSGKETTLSTQAVDDHTVSMYERNKMTHKNTPKSCRTPSFCKRIPNPNSTCTQLRKSPNINDSLEAVGRQPRLARSVRTCWTQHIRKIAETRVGAGRRRVDANILQRDRNE